LQSSQFPDMHGGSLQKWRSKSNNATIFNSYQGYPWHDLNV